MTKSTCDALIIGAGPAGSTAAFLLATQGFKVVILDRKQFPRPKLCGGLLTWKTIKTVEAVFQVGLQTLKPQRIIHHESRTYAVSDRRRRTFRRNLDDPFYLVDRQAYDHFWLQCAVSAGAEFYPDSAVVEIDPDKQEAVTAQGEKWTGRFILGADGVHSRVRHALVHAQRTSEPCREGIASCLECFVPKLNVRELPDCPVIYYGYVPRGYAWSFPGPDHWILGIAALRTRVGRGLKTCFLDFLSDLKIDSPNHLRIRGHGLPYGNHLRSPGHGSILLVGDAAGLADPFLGEGIYYAHRSAQLAAQAAIEAYRRPDAALSRYHENFRRIIYRELRCAWAGRQVVFALPAVCYYPFLTLALRLIPKICEETIQGKRSFQWFRKTPFR
jgi:geranylgeranyl reductase family protein